MKVVAVLGQADGAVLRVAAPLGEMVAVACSPEPEPPALRRAHAHGAQQLLRLWDALLDNAGEMTQAAALAALVRRLEVPLVVVGESLQGLLGPALAEMLNLPHLSAVRTAELSAAPEQPGAAALRVLRRSLQGNQWLRGPATGVLCVLPSLDGDSAAQPASAPSEATIATWDLSALLVTAVDLPRMPVCIDDQVPCARYRPLCFHSVAALAERLRHDGLE